MDFYPWIRNALFRFDAETVHHCALKCLALPGASGFLQMITDPVLGTPVRLWDLTFPSAVGLAAGFDKNAEVLEAWQAMRFGFVEVGTITPLPQTGNARPRIHRFPAQRALVNSMGFPNDGLDAIAARLQRYRSKPVEERIPIGANIGKGRGTDIAAAFDDYARCLRGLHAFADYFVVNISSPNTPGLRQLQNESELRSLLEPLRKEMDALNTAATDKKQLLFKIAPDLSEEQIDTIAGLAISCGMDGIVATNTTLDHSPLNLAKPLPGGLSGMPVREKSTAVISRLSKHLSGKMPIIGCGGVFGPDDVREKLDAGASLVQVYTAFVYLGPRSVNILTAT